MSLSYQDLCAFLYREARHLDDREWDEWLAMYDENCTFCDYTFISPSRSKRIDEANPVNNTQFSTEGGVKKSGVAELRRARRAFG